MPGSKAWHRVYAAFRRQSPHQAQQRHALGMRRAVRLQHDVYGRFALVRARNLACGAGAILGGPARPQPVGRGQSFAVQTRQRHLALHRHLAQHGIDQWLEVHRLGIPGR